MSKPFKHTIIDFVRWLQMIIDEQGPTYGGALILFFAIGWLLLLPVYLPLWLLGKLFSFVLDLINPRTPDTP